MEIEHLFYPKGVFESPGGEMRIEKRRRLEMTVTTIQRRWGHNALRKVGVRTATVEVPHISTGFPVLDQALGIGGLPLGRIAELVGPPTSGKTTLALKFLVQAQAGGQVGYVDHARAFDPDYAHRCGLNLARLLILTPYGLEEALAMTEATVRSGGLSALVFDGLDVLWSEPQAAPLLAACLVRIVAPLAQTGTALLFLRAPIESSAGLSALAHQATVQLRITREQWIRHRGDVRGYNAQVEIAKNRLGPSQCRVTIAIKFNGVVQGDGL